jgi:hypothetical protein
VTLGFTNLETVFKEFFWDSKHKVENEKQNHWYISLSREFSYLRFWKLVSQLLSKDCYRLLLFDVTYIFVYYIYLQISPFHYPNLILISFHFFQILQLQMNDFRYHYMFTTFVSFHFIISSRFFFLIFCFLFWEFSPLCCVHIQGWRNIYLIKVLRVYQRECVFNFKNLYLWFLFKL